MTEQTPAWGFGLATLDGDGTVLDVWFPAPALGEKPADAVCPTELAALAGHRRRTGASPARCCWSRSPTSGGADDHRGRVAAPAPALHRLVAPHAVNLDGVFGLLTNVVWTTAGPCAGRGLRADPRPAARARAATSPSSASTSSRGWSTTSCPSGVRIADADRVRLGAHLAEGTTVMHEGFVNYNAGTLGASMVEGRISAGVVVGDGSDVGGGASIMGTLSGGGKQVISIGERCLLGANAGIGISLGDDCVVEAGCYVTAGTKVTVPDRDGTPQVVKALELSGAEQRAVPPQLGHRRARGGAVEGDGVELNAALHAN